jgi:hypothetical protein
VLLFQIQSLITLDVLFLLTSIFLLLFTPSLFPILPFHSDDRSFEPLQALSFKALATFGPPKVYFTEGNYFLVGINGVAEFYLLDG